MKIYKLYHEEYEDCLYFTDFELANVIQNNPRFDGFWIKEVELINFPKAKIEIEQNNQVDIIINDYFSNDFLIKEYKNKWEKDLDDLFVLIEDEKIKEARELFNKLNEKFTHEDLLKADTMLYSLEND